MADRTGYLALLTSALIREARQKRLLGRPYLVAHRLMRIQLKAFETGALIGLALADQFDVFITPLSGVREGDDAIDGKRLALATGFSMARAEADAQTMWELLIIHDMLISKTEQPLSEWHTWWTRIGNSEADLPTATTRAYLSGLGGAGFAAQWPDRTRQIYTRSHEMVDPLAWKWLFSAGLVDTEEPEEFSPIEERQRAVKSGFAKYCRDFWPEYLEPLGLGELVD